MTIERAASNLRSCAVTDGSLQAAVTCKVWAEFVVFSMEGRAKVGSKLYQVFKYNTKARASERCYDECHIEHKGLLDCEAHDCEGATCTSATFARSNSASANRATLERISKEGHVGQRAARPTRQACSNSRNEPTLNRGT